MSDLTEEIVLCSRKYKPLVLLHLKIETVSIDFQFQLIGIHVSRDAKHDSLPPFYCLRFSLTITSTHKVKITTPFRETVLMSMKICNCKLGI